MKEIEALLGLWSNRRRASAEVKRMAVKHIADLDRRSPSCRRCAARCRALANHCHGDERPDCPILDDLAGTSRKGHRIMDDAAPGRRTPIRCAA